MLQRRDFGIMLILTCTAALLFLPFLGSVHLFDWDEINFAEISREMLLTGDYFRVHINFEPFWEKPPLFFWLQSASMLLFGVNEFAARLPNALVGCFILPVLYVAGKRLFDGSFGLLWACLYLGSFLPAFYCKSGIIDPLFNLWMFLGVYWLIRITLQTDDGVDGQHSDPKPVVSYRGLMMAGFWTGLAVLTKGPVGYILIVATWLSVWGFRRLHKKESVMFPWMEIPFFTLIVLFVSLAWYGVELYKHGFWFFQEFLRYQIRLLTTGDAGHSQPFYYHFLVVIVGCFPASAFAFSAFRKAGADTAFQQNAKEWMIVLLAVVLGVFTIVQTKIVHYSSMAYYPVTFLGAYSLYGMLKRQSPARRLHQWLTLGLGLLWAVLLALVPLIGINLSAVLPYIRDEFARANLTAPVTWTGFEPLIGGMYAAAVIVSVVLLQKQRIFESVLMIVSATIVAFFSFTAVVAPNIEGYTQRAAINFYKSLQGQDCYCHVLGFKSYAHLFYTLKTRAQSPSGANISAEDFEAWLLEGEIDKTAYFVCKSTNAGEWRGHPNLKEISTQHGFVFFRRDPRQRPNVAFEVKRPFR